MPEVKLWCSVIIQAIKDYKKFCRTGYGGESEGGSAEYFLFKERNGAFELVCELIGMDADRTRLKIFNEPDEVVRGFSNYA